MERKTDLRKQYLLLANEQLNPKANDLKALEQVLINWFCMKFETTPNDPRLLGMRLDELLLFRMMHEIQDRPSVLMEIEADDHETWLKKEMGDDYRTAEQLTDDHVALDKQEAQLAETLPDRIDTELGKE